MKRRRVAGIALFLLFAARPAMADCIGSWGKVGSGGPISARVGHAMAYDSSRGKSVLFGGIDGTSHTLNDTWEYDGTNWTQRLPSAPPSIRHGHSMAYDSNRHVTTLFGGANLLTFYGETWEWNGSQWTQRTPTASPPNRVTAAMAYDSARGVTVLFGGLTSGATLGSTVYLGDTWEWDGSNWTQMTTPTAPSARLGHTMVFDRNRNVIVLFGGQTSATTLSSETWEWNGQAWSLRSPVAHPSPRVGHSASFDSVRNMTVIFGGVISAGAAVADTIEYDGKTWALRGSFDAPSSRSGQAMVFDSLHSRHFLYGGSDGSASDQTWQWSAPLVDISQQPADQSVVSGLPATFTVDFADQTNPFFIGTPVTYQWRKDGVPLSDGGAVSGSLTKTLTIGAAQPGDSGAYDCVIDNVCGKIASRAAMLDTCKSADSADDCNSNGILDSCEIASNASLDLNGNGVLDACEPNADSLTPGGASSAQAVPCGVCGGGAAGLMPLAIISLGVMRRRRDLRKRQE